MIAPRPEQFGAKPVEVAGQVEQQFYINTLTVLIQRTIRPAPPSDLEDEAFTIGHCIRWT